jgi:hypothetical protein
LRVAPPWWTNLPYAGFLFLSAARAGLALGLKDAAEAEPPVRGDGGIQLGGSGKRAGGAIGGDQSFGGDQVDVAGGGDAAGKSGGGEVED